MSSASYSVFLKTNFNINFQPIVLCPKFSFPSETKKVHPYNINQQDALFSINLFNNKLLHFSSSSSGGSTLYTQQFV